MTDRLLSAFTAHPATVGESYFGHLLFAAHIGLLLVAAGLAAFVHALLPFLFETTASRIVQTLADRTRRRQQAAPRGPVSLGRS
ncbi:MAG: hypothetical protein HKM95_05220 [Inquilinus sp.]|nr:hypothetical protein [Inquilinus sp.]